MNNHGLTAGALLKLDVVHNERNAVKCRSSNSKSLLTDSDYGHQMVVDDDEEDEDPASSFSFAGPYSDVIQSHAPTQGTNKAQRH